MQCSPEDRNQRFGSMLWLYLQGGRVRFFVVWSLIKRRDNSDLHLPFARYGNAHRSRL
jgi:hypothetical protein